MVKLEAMKTRGMFKAREGDELLGVVFEEDGHGWFAISTKGGELLGPSPTRERAVGLLSRHGKTSRAGLVLGEPVRLERPGSSLDGTEGTLQRFMGNSAAEVIVPGWTTALVANLSELRRIKKETK